MPVQMGGDGVERAFYPDIMVKRLCFDAEGLEQGVARTRGVEQAMHVDAPDPAVGGYGTVGTVTVEMSEGTLHISARGAADVNFITVKARAAIRQATGDRPQHLVAIQ